jgi:type IV fimbrial biogenesis protein FimT
VFTTIRIVLRMNAKPADAPLLARGFTLLELMAAIAVLAVLLAIGVPSFTDMLRNNRVTTSTNNVVTAISMARSEALKRGMPVTLCSANDAGTACRGDAATDWSAGGYLLFTDRVAPAGAITASGSAPDLVLQRFARTPNGVTIASSTTGAAGTPIGYLRFGPSGAPENGADVLLTVRHTTCTGQNLRVIEVLRTGRINTERQECP